MRRHLLTFVSALLLLLCAFTVVSTTLYDGRRLTYTFGGDGQSTERTIGLASGGGYVQVWTVHGPSGWRNGFHQSDSQSRRDRYRTANHRGHFAGFRWYSTARKTVPNAPAAVAEVLQMPLGLVISMLLAPPLLWFAYFVSSRARPHGFCRRCGYNLAGNTSGVCPECGLVLDQGCVGGHATA